MAEQARTNVNPDTVKKVDHTSYGRPRRSRRRSGKIIALSAALSVALLILFVVSIYSTATISAINKKNRKLGAALAGAREHIEQLTPELNKAQQDLDQLVQGRFPNLQELITNQVLPVENEYIRNVVFTVIKQRKKERYKYLLVVENDSSLKIKPSFRVLFFDRYGVHMATDEVHDTEILASGESRDYTSDIEFLFDTEPRHFYIDDITASEQDK